MRRLLLVFCSTAFAFATFPRVSANAAEMPNVRRDVRGDDEALNYALAWHVCLWLDHRD
jgi:hypothetical protein